MRSKGRCLHEEISQTLLTNYKEEKCAVLSQVHSANLQEEMQYMLCGIGAEEYKKTKNQTGLFFRPRSILTYQKEHLVSHYINLDSAYFTEFSCIRAASIIHGAMAAYTVHAV
jgi:hypothetical protein